MLFNNKKLSVISICNSISELQNHYSKVFILEKDTKNNLLPYSSYMRYQKKVW